MCVRPGRICRPPRNARGNRSFRRSQMTDFSRLDMQAFEVFTRNVYSKSAVQSTYASQRSYGNLHFCRANSLLGGRSARVSKGCYERSRLGIMVFYTLGTQSLTHHQKKEPKSSKGTRRKVQVDESCNSWASLPIGHISVLVRTNA